MGPQRPGSYPWDALGHPGNATDGLGLEIPTLTIPMTTLLKVCLHVGEVGLMNSFLLFVKSPKTKKNVGRHLQFVQIAMSLGFLNPLKVEFPLWEVVGMTFPQLLGGHFIGEAQPLKRPSPCLPLI